MNPPICLIAALTETHVIGNQGVLPWGHIEGDLAYFKEKTLGCVVIMGRLTQLSIGRELPGRINLVVTNQPPEPHGNTNYVSSPELALKAATSLSKGGKIFVIGGGMMYNYFLPLADELYLNYVPGEYEGDVYFPSFSETDWIRESVSYYPAFRAEHLIRSKE